MSTSAPNPPAIRRAHRAVLGLALAALTVHFGMTLLYLTPTNPIRMALAAPMEGYMLPWFEQRWELFAPSPVGATRYLLVACRTDEDEADPPWHDVSSALLDAKYRYRITPADRLQRAVQAATGMIFPTKRDLVDKMRSRPEDFEEDLTRIEEAQSLRRQAGERLLARVASADCDNRLGQGVTTSVRARIVLRESPPYSRRTDDDRSGEVKVVELDWKPYQRVAGL
jgi:hypothetical protein